TTLNCNYAVGISDSSPDLNYISSKSLYLASGATLVQTAIPNNPALLSLPNPGGAGSLGVNKNIIIQPPQFNGVVRWIAPAIDGTGDIWVGGDFTTYGGVSVPRIARLN